MKARYPIYKFTVEQIMSSPDVASWLSQFPEDQKSTAMDALGKLCFVSADSFSQWVRDFIDSLDDSVYAFYAVRRFPRSVKYLWEKNGSNRSAPLVASGSEDFANSVIANACRNRSRKFLNTPSFRELKNHKLCTLILVDDVSGTGSAMAGYIRRMMAYRPFLARWSLGCLRLILLSFYRTKQAEGLVNVAIRGSDHPVRKIRKSSKFRWESCVYQDGSRVWSDENIQLFINTKRVVKAIRLGYESSLCSVVFNHSVPNNLPGVFWSSTKKWKALFPNRTVPGWLYPLLLGDEGTIVNTHLLFPMLNEVAKGVRVKLVLASQLGVAPEVVSKMITCAKTVGLVDVNLRLTAAGDRFLLEHKDKASHKWDRSLYLPSSWCAD